MHYHYPKIMEFVDSITSLFIILTVPALTYGIYALLRMAVSKKNEINIYTDTEEAKAQKLVYLFSVIVLAMVFAAYFYYVFFKLGYFFQFGKAIEGLLLSIMYLILSPFFFIFSIFQLEDIRSGLFVDPGLLLDDMKSWFGHKFGIYISDLTRSTILVLVKLLTLLLFSTKIINVSKFLIFHLLKVSNKTALIGAVLIFSVLFVSYTFVHHDELMQLINLMQKIVIAFSQGIMK